MSCRKFDQDAYERDLTEYIRDALKLPSGCVDVLVRHVPSQWTHTDENGELIFITDLEVVLLGSTPAYFSVRLDGWWLERSIEEDLGGRFVHALRLLGEACLDAEEHHFEALIDEGKWHDI